jgi:hypothetical protein
LIRSASAISFGLSMKPTRNCRPTVSLFVNSGLIAELLAKLAEEFVLHLFRYRLHEP